MAAKPELSLHIMSGLLLCFTQHVRDYFHFIAIVKGWILALQSGLPKMTRSGCWHARGSVVS